MSDQVAEIKSKVDIAQIIGERVALKQRGRRFVALCPFHSEKTPSFTVSPELGIFKCFGCNSAGDVFTFLELHDGMTFVEALEFLAEKTGVRLERRFVDSRMEKVDRQILDVNHLAAEYFHFILTKHRVGQKAMGYLKSRKIFRPAIDQFFLGYSPHRWDSLLAYLTKKGYEPEILVQAGLVIPRAKGQGLYDRFRGRVMFPLRNPRGQAVGFAGRLLDASPEEAKYINSPETPVYHKGKHLFGIYENREEIRKAGFAVLVEGEFDCLSSWQAGVKNVAAVKGTALTPDQIKLIRRYTKQICLSLDADSAGWEALIRSLNAMGDHGMLVRAVALPEGLKDPDELARQDPAKWKQSVAAAKSVYELVVTKTLVKIGAVTGEQKRLAGETLVPVLAGMKNAIEQDYWFKEVAKRLNVREEAVRQEAAAFRQTGSQPRLNPVAEQVKPIRAEILSRYLLGLIIQKSLPVPPDFGLDWVEPLGRRRIFELLRQDHPSETELRRFRDSLPEELKNLFDESALMPITSGLKSSLVDREVLKAGRELEIEWIRKQLQIKQSPGSRIKEFTVRLRELLRRD